MLEYALLACLIALVAMTGVARVGDETYEAHWESGKAIQSALSDVDKNRGGGDGDGGGADPG